MLTISFTREERDAVLPQLSCRLDELETLMSEEAIRKNTKRVLELAKFIENIRNFTNTLINAK